MDLFQAFVLGVLQGVTEFLPISSSGHLVIGEWVFGLKVDGLKSFDVALHIGSLLAIFVYFRNDVWGLLKAFARLFGGKFDGEYAKLILFIVIGTLPAVFAGLFLEKQIDAVFRNINMIGISMMVVGVIFVIGEWVHKKVAKESDELTLKKVLVIGIAQAVALIPGVSRSGSTIVAGLFQGTARESAARFSFLLGMPAILGAGILTALKSSGGASISFDLMFFGAFVSFVFSLLSVWFLMKFLKKHTLLVFAIYLIVVGSFVLYQATFDALPPVDASFVPAP